MCIQHLSPNNACMRTVYKWFRRSNCHLSLKIWTPTDMSGKWCTKLFPKLHPKPKAVSELKFTLEKTRENFPQNKSCPEYQKEVERVGKGWWTFWAFPINQKKCSQSRCLHSYIVLNAISARQLLIKSKPQRNCHD